MTCHRPALIRVIDLLGHPLEEILSGDEEDRHAGNAGSRRPLGAVSIRWTVWDHQMASIPIGQ